MKHDLLENAEHVHDIAQTVLLSWKISEISNLLSHILNHLSSTTSFCYFLFYY